MNGRRIGIDVRALTPPLSGIGVYCREVIRRLAALAPDNDYFCYTTKPPPASHLPGADAGGRFHARVGRGLTALWGSIWLQTGVNRLIAADRLDLFWAPLQVAPLKQAGVMPLVVTAHDLVFKYFPETMSWRNRAVLARYAGRSFRAADAIMADSRATADAVIREFGVDPAKVRVVHLAAGNEFRPMDPAAARRVARDRFAVDRDYLLFVGTLEPRKNLAGLLRALAILERERSFSRDAMVVITGARGWKTAPIASLIQGHPMARSLLFTGYVAAEDLPALYAGARLFVMPSTYEGFGLPVLEAMRCGTPVVSTDAPPLPEVSGGAARLVPVGDDRALAEALHLMWRDDALRRAAREAGLARAARFSWEITARAVLDTLEKAIVK
ncbi:MAG: glycosyltransferase family 4 protein [Planctomycetes bacterium]|nr:glycosyltransferase family 4 protein [Planctomycetota bacterium]